MNLPAPLEVRIRRYLDDVRRALADRPAALREAITDDLRNQVLDALAERASGRDPTAADLDAVLEGMDPAEAFAAPPVESAAAPARGGRQWVLLALAFLGVNVWGVWRLARRAAPAGTVWVREFLPGHDAEITGAMPLRWRFSTAMVESDCVGRAPDETPLSMRPAIAGRFLWQTDRELIFSPDEPWPLCTTFEMHLDDALADRRGRLVGGERAFRVRSSALQLVRVEQADYSEQGATLRLIFNAAPQRTALARGMTIRRPHTGETLPFRFLGEAISREVLISVRSMEADRLGILLEAGLRPQTGTLGLEEAIARTVDISTRLALTRLQPVVPPFDPPALYAYFTAATDPIAAAEFVQIEPALPFRLRPLDEWRGAGLIVEADFEPGAIYTVRFSAGLHASHGAPLGEEVVRHVQFPDRPPSLAFAADGRYLSPAGPMVVPLSTVNVSQCAVRLHRILPQNLVFHAMRESDRYERSYSDERAAHEKLGELVGERQMAAAGTTNRPAALRIDLRDWLEDESCGAYVIAAGADRANVAEKLVIVTDLALSAKMGRDGVFVWVTSLCGGTPVAGVRVTLFAENNRVLAEGVTGADGAARLAARMDDPDARPFLLLARLDRDLSYLKLEGAPVVEGGAPGARAFLAEGHEAYLFTDRGIFRPGETLRVKAIVRDRAQAAPEPFPVSLRVIRPDGRLHRERTALLSEFGTAEWSAPWPDFLPLGRYRIELRTPGTESALGQTTVLLEEYAPPQIAASIHAAEGRARTGADLCFEVRARHLFGRPAAGLPATARVIVEPAPFAPEGWNDWRFGDEEKSFAPVTLDLGRRALDPEGAGSWSFPLAAEWRPPAALRATLAATVIERSGRAVTAWASRPVDSYPLYIGLRAVSDGGSVVSGREQTVAVAAVSPTGAADASVTRLDAELYRAEWTTLLRRRADGRYAYETVRTLDSRGTAAVALTDGRGETRFTPDRAGSYVLIVRDPNSGVSSSLRLHAAEPGARWVGWAMERPDQLEISMDRERYRPGDTARAAVKTPFAGTALVTIESDRVLEHRVVEIKGNTAEFEFAVTADWGPNVYAVVSVIRPVTPAEVWTAHRAAGAAAIRMDAPDRRLDVAIEAPAEIRPQSRLDAKVRVRDAAGAPATHAEVIVAAVDEGICSLTAFAAPDPVAWFLSQRRLGIGLFDVYGNLLPIVEERTGGPNAHAPGGEASLGLSRQLNPVRAHRFRPTALWSGTIPAGEDGMARVAFDVPEFTGKLRLMAVAINRTATGSAAQSTVVKRPFVVQPGLPRFLAPGDRCDMPVQIFNETGADQRMRIAISTEGPLQAGAFETEFDLAAGGERTVRVPMTAGAAPGAAVCRIVVSAGAERYEESIELAVRPPAPPVTVTHDGMVAEGEIVNLSPPDGWLPGTAYIELWCGPRPEIALGGAVDELLRYPYGCLEQTVSASFPLLYLADLVNRVRPGALGGMETDHFVRAGILRVLGMQQAHGGFSVWPHAGEYPWGSVYAAHFLVEAQQAGHNVPADCRDAALDYLRALLRRAAPADADPAAAAWRDDMACRAYACHVLALTGRPDHGWNARLLAVSDRLGAAARAHLASALMLSGRPRDAAALLDGAADIAEGPRERGGNLDSPVRDLALELAARVELNPADPRATQLAMRLHGLRVNGAWHSTQENAIALMAMGKLYRTLPARTAPYTAALVMDGQRQSFTQAKFFRWAGPAPASGIVRIESQGPGGFLYYARWQGVPADGRIEEDDRGIRVRRQMLDLEGRSLERSRWAQGDVAVVRLVLDTFDAVYDNIVIEDLLPAGLEIENPALATSESTPWIRSRSDWVLHRDLRDDRLILFTGSIGGRREFHYAVRAVTPGHFVWPAVQAGAMYDPAIRSAHGAGWLEVE